MAGNAFFDPTRSLCVIIGSRNVFFSALDHNDTTELQKNNAHVNLVTEAEESRPANPDLSLPEASEFVFLTCNACKFAYV